MDRARFVFSVLFGVAYLVGVAGVAARGDVTGFLVMLGIVLLACIYVIYLLQKALRKPVITATKEELRLSYGGFTFARGSRWPRSTIARIGAWQGLWVVARGKRNRLLAERNDEELLWVAAVLRQYLRVPKWMQEAVDEIPVTMEDSIFNAPTPGFLRSRPGELRVRHAFAAFPWYRFRAAKGSYVSLVQIVRSGGISRLSPVDLTCRIESDGSALRITPSGSSFQLTARCKEPEALPKAVARFWAASEE
jgi:hypothetical protein